MRKTVQFIVATGFFAATMTGLPGVATAVQGVKQVPAECTLGTNGTTSASVLCKYTNSRYRVAVDYCRVNCTREYGPWKYYPYNSEVVFPPGGTIVRSWSEIE